MSDEKRHFLDLSEEQLLDWLSTVGAPAYRAGQILKWIYERRATQFEEMSDLPKALREQLESHFRLFQSEIALKQESEDGTEKAAFAIAGWRSHRMRSPSRWRTAFHLREQPSRLRDGLCLLRIGFGWCRSQSNQGRDPRADASLTEIAPDGRTT